MDLRTLLWKETIAVRRRPGLVVVLLVVLPAVLVGGTVVFERTVPQDVPVGVVAEEDASSDELAVARAGLASLSRPVTYETETAARRALLREEIYLIVRVPGGLFDPNATARFTVVSDSGFVPFDEPVNESVGVIQSQFDAAFPATVRVTHRRMGAPHTLSEFLVPTGLFAFVVLYALLYVPYQVRAERTVLDRLRAASRLDVVIGSKLLATGSALVAPLAVVAATSAWLGYRVDVLTPLGLVTVGLAFAFLAAIGIGVMFLLNLRRTGLFVNLGMAVGVFALSGLVYPVGFFSTLQRTIARRLPTHYAAITLRSGMLRDVSPGLYADYLLWLGGTVLVAFAVLKLSLVVFERRQ